MYSLFVNCILYILLLVVLLFQSCTCRFRTSPSILTGIFRTFNSNPHPALLHLRIQRLPDSEAVRPDHQSSLHRDVGQRSLPASNPACERTLANGLHLLQDRWLGLVLPVHGSGRLLPLHHRLEAIPDDGSVRCSRDARPRLTSDRREPGAGAASPATAQRQRPVLRVSRVEGLSPTTGIGAHAWGAAVSPDDAGQDRTLSPFDEERGQAGELLLSMVVGKSHG